MIELRLADKRVSVPQELRERVVPEPDGLDDELADREVGLELRGLFSGAAVDLADIPPCVGGGQGFVFELRSGEFGSQAFEARVVAQNPAVHVLGVAQGVAREPFDAEVRVCVAGEVEEVEECEDGAVRGADDAYGCWF